MTQPEIFTHMKDIKEKTEKKVYFFATVQDMLSYRFYKLGDIAKTAGYYKSGDGGGADYRITTDPSDGFFSHPIASNFTATLLIGDNNTVNLKQIGGKPQDILGKYDNKTYVDAYIRKIRSLENQTERIKLYIPAGVWYFSPTIIYNNRGFSITGDLNFSHATVSTEGTIIAPLTPDQQYVWSIGNGTAAMYNFEFGNLTFSTSQFEHASNHYEVRERYKTTKSALIFQGAANGFVKPIYFYEIDGRALEITSSREINFDKLTFRGISDFNKSVVCFSRILDTLRALPNNSNLIFDCFDFEVCAGDLLEFEATNNFLNSEIRTIIFEATSYSLPDSTASVLAETFKEAEAVKQAIFHFAGEFSGNKIGSILLNNFSWNYAVKGSQQYVYDTVIKTTGQGYAVQLNIDTIAVHGARKDYDIIHNPLYAPAAMGNFLINQIHSNDTAAKPRFNVINFPPIKVNQFLSRDRDVAGEENLSPNMIAAKDVSLRPVGEYTYSGILYYDANAVSSLKLVVKPMTWIDRIAGNFIRILNDNTKNYAARVRINEGVLFSMRVYGFINGVEEYITVDLVGVGTYTWYDILTENIFDDGTYITLNTQTQQHAYFDVIRSLEGQNKDKKQTHFFPSLTGIEESAKFKVGDLVITDGFYNDGDGGGAHYRVTSDIPDNYFVHRLPNGLSATIIIGSDNTINLKQIGGRPQDATGKYDNRPYLQAYFVRIRNLSDTSRRFKLYIPSGIWCFSATNLHNQAGFSVTGDFSYTHADESNQGTIIAPFADNQEYVWSVGNGSERVYNFEIGNLTMTTASFVKNESIYQVDARFKTTRSALILQGVTRGFVKPIHFHDIDGTALEITACREVSYDKLTFRNVSDFTKPVVFFRRTPALLQQFNFLLTSLLFDYFDFERCSGDLIEFDANISMFNSEIRTIIYESTHSYADNFGLVSDETFDVINAKKLSILRLNGTYNNNKIGSILIRDFARTYAVKNGVQYIYDTVVHAAGSYNLFQLNIDTIAVSGAGKDFDVLYNSGEVNSLSSIHINEVRKDYNADIKALFNVTNFGQIKVDTMPDNGFSGKQPLASNMISAKELMLRTPPVPGNYFGMLNYDKDAYSLYGLTVEPIRHVPLDKSNTLQFLNDKSKQYSIRAKLTVEKTAPIRLVGPVDGVSTTITVIISGTGTYRWYNILTNNVFDDGEHITINIMTNEVLNVDILRTLTPPQEDKVHHFASVETMLSYANFKVGDLAITNGFYSTGDGGGASYRITNNARDGYFVHELPNGLSATLIIGSDNMVNLKQIGGRAQNTSIKYDNKPYIDAYLARLRNTSDPALRFKLYIPSGRWCFSATAIYSQRGLSITGDFNYAQEDNQGTIIAPFEDEQEYVWSIGDGQSFSQNMEIGNLTITTASYERVDGIFRRNARFKTTRSALVFQGVRRAFVKPIYFYDIDGSALELMGAREINFDKLTFRNLSDFTKPVVTFTPASTGIIQYMGSSYTLLFDCLEFEDCAGDLIDFNVGIFLQNTEIRTILYRGGSFSNVDNGTVSDQEFIKADAKSCSVVVIRGEWFGNKIGSILLSNFARSYGLSNRNQYVHDTVFSVLTNLLLLELKVDTIEIINPLKDVNVLFSTFDYKQNSKSNVYINDVINIVNNTSNAQALLNVIEFCPIYINNMVDSSFSGNRYLAADMIAAKDITIRPIGDFSYPGTWCYDKDAFSANKLVVKNNKSNLASISNLLRFLNDKQKNIAIRAKTDTGNQVGISLVGKVAGVDTVVTTPIIGTGAYEWYTVLTNNPFDDGTYVILRIMTDTNVYIDVLRYTTPPIAVPSPVEE